MERRHIAEYETIIVRQEILISTVILKGQHKLMPIAIDLLNILRGCLEMAWVRLRDLEGR